MAPVCSICRREDRASLEDEHVQGMSLRAIAARHKGTTAWSLRRHFQHVARIIENQQKLQERQEVSDRATGKLPARVEQLIAELERITVNALRRKDHTTALRAIAQRRECLKTIGEISGELGPRTPGEYIPANIQVNVGEPAAPRMTNEQFIEHFRSLYGLPPRKLPDKIM
jgi:hypothetical protein